MALLQVDHVLIAAKDRKPFHGHAHVIRLRRGATEETVSASGNSKCEAAAEAIKKAIKKAIDDGWF